VGRRRSEFSLAFSFFDHDYCFREKLAMAKMLTIENEQETGTTWFRGDACEETSVEEVWDGDA
jgi:hypothetical protein